MNAPDLVAEYECLWTAKDVARYLRSSRSYVYKIAEAGLLPCLRVCGLRFEPEIVRAFARGEHHNVITLKPGRNPDRRSGR